jgi:hypothetical protein
MSENQIFGLEARSFRRTSNAVRFVESLPQYRLSADYGKASLPSVFAGLPVVGRIASAATGSGKYWCWVGTPPTFDISDVADLSLDDLGLTEDLLAGDPNGLMLNAQEYGFDDSHDLTMAGNDNELNFHGFVQRVNTNGLIVVAFNGLWRGC